MFRLRRRITCRGSPAGATGLLAIQVTYDRSSLRVDETVAAQLTVRNLTRTSQNMLLVTVGVPPDFELQAEDLDQRVAERVISRDERTANQLILYVTRIEASATLELGYRLRASMPVRAADGGSEVALYYEPDQEGEQPFDDLDGHGQLSSESNFGWRAGQATLPRDP